MIQNINEDHNRRRGDKEIGVRRCVGNVVENLAIHFVKIAV